MSAHDSTEPAPAPDVLAEVERAMGVLQVHPDTTVREAVTTMLEGIDAVHRTGLTHLVQAIHGMTGDTLVNRLVADPAIRMLLMSYDLVAVDRRLQAEEALDTVRGHLHDHGIDVEIQEVVGGVVYVRLHVARQDGRDALPLDRIRTDLEAALREFLIGFQELEFRDRDLHAPPSAIVPLAALRRANRPVYHDALNADELPEGTLRAAMVKDVSVLFARVAGEVYAIRNQCGDSPLPLDLGTLEGAEVRCSWHGCRYDIRSGRRLDDEGRVQVLPVTTEAGRIRVAIDVETGGAIVVRVVVAAFGNELRGDDGFGIAVLRCIEASRPTPHHVTLLEVGTAGLRLAQELLTPCDRLIVIDAMTRGGKPGTVYVLKIDDVPEARDVDMHLAVPSRALSVAQALGTLPPETFLIGCEPADVDELVMELSDSVRAAVDVAANHVHSLIGERDDE